MVAGAVEALNARDVGATVEGMHERFEWRPAATAGGDLEGVVYRGTEGIRQYFADMDEFLTNTHMDVESMEELDRNRVLLRARVTARGRASGVLPDVAIWSIWEIRDGKMIRGTGFRTQEEALEAVALGE